MSHHLPDTKIPAPCIVNTGIIVNKLDIRRLLNDLGRVHYIYTQENKLLSEGDGDVMEVFANPHRSTLVANNALYLNVASFDYEYKHWYGYVCNQYIKWEINVDSTIQLYNLLGLFECLDVSNKSIIVTNY